VAYQKLRALRGDLRNSQPPADGLGDF
jgi:hypothetical protein